MAYGLNTGGGTPDQQAQAGLGSELGARQQLNRQQQTRYAPKNRMNQANKLAGDTSGRLDSGNMAMSRGTASSPVTADGKINEANESTRNSAHEIPNGPLQSGGDRSPQMAQMQTAQQTALNQTLTQPAWNPSGTPGQRGTTAAGMSSTRTVPGMSLPYVPGAAPGTPGGPPAGTPVPGAPGAPGAPGTPGTGTPTPAIPPPTTPDPFQGRGVWNGSGWLPNDHPDAYKFLGPGGMNAGTMTPADRDHTGDIAAMMKENPGQFPDAAAAQAWGEMGPRGGGRAEPRGGTPGTPGAPSAPAGPWDGSISNQNQIGQIPPGSTYKPGRLPGFEGEGWQAAVLPNDPNAIYGGSEFSQWQSPDQASQDARNKAAINRTMDQDVVDVNLMNAKSADMQGQALQEALQGQKNNAAARGMLGGGFTTALESGTREQSASALLDAQRQNRIDAATRNRDYLNTAIDKSEAFQTGQMNRSDISYGNTLKGQAASAVDKQAAIDSQNQAKQQALDLAMKQAGLDKTSWDSGMQVHQQNMSDALAQEGLLNTGADSVFKNWSTAQEQWLRNKGLNIDEVLGKDRNAITREVGLGGIDADRYRTDKQYQTDVMKMLIGVEEGDKNRGVDFTRIFAPAIAGG